MWLSLLFIIHGVGKVYLRANTYIIQDNKSEVSDDVQYVEQSENSYEMFQKETKYEITYVCPDGSPNIQEVRYQQVTH